MARRKNKSSLSPKAEKNVTHDGYFLHLTESVEMADQQPRNESMDTLKKKKKSLTLLFPSKITFFTIQV